MAKTSKTTEVLDVTILPERDLDTEIKQELVKANVTDQVIAALEEKYGSLKLSAIDSKEDYLEICEARKQVRKVGIMAEKICKKGREDAILIQKKWLSKEKDVLDKIAITQDKLDAEIKKYEDEVARKEEEERQRQEKNFQERQSRIIKMGATYNNGSFEINGVSYETDTLRTADDETWNDIMLPKYQREFEKLEKVRFEEEQRKEAEATKLREEQEKLQKEREEFEKQREEMRKQQEELNSLKMEQERKEMEARQKEADELRVKRDTQNKARMQQVMDLGLVWSVQYKSFILEDVAVAAVDIETYDQEKWDKMIEEITPTIARNKEEIAKREQEKRNKEIEEAQKEAVAKEHLRLENERLENERLAEEKMVREAEDAAKASDKDKWNAWIVELGKTLPLPELKSPTYLNKSKSANELIKKIMEL